MWCVGALCVPHQAQHFPFFPLHLQAVPCGTAPRLVRRKYQGPRLEAAVVEYILSCPNSDFSVLLTVKRKKSSKIEAKGTASKVAGKKITKIIGLGKKKPWTDEQTSSAEEDMPTCGKAAVLPALSP